MILVAETYAHIESPQVRLNGELVNMFTGTIQLNEATIDGYDPSQLTRS